MDVNVASQEEDDNSILNFYRKAISLRKRLSCVRNGNYVEYNKLSSSLYTYSREDDKQLILQNYAEVDSALLKPYEVRVYLWEK